MKTNTPTATIIVPTLNEEKYLPKLLDSLSKQTFTDFEVIIADANSKDNTVKVAKDWGATVVEGGRPSTGRNNAVRASTTEHIFALDADVIVPEDFLQNALEEIRIRQLDCATWAMHPSDGDLPYALLFEAITRTQKLAVLMNQPFAAGAAIYFRREIFNKINGFDESLYLSEDHDFVKKAGKIGKFRFLKSVKAGVSTRRWRKEGGLKMAIKYLYSILYLGLFGSIKEEIMEYEFGNYDEIDEERFILNMKRFLEQLKRLEKQVIHFETKETQKLEILEEIQETFLKTVRRITNRK